MTDSKERHKREKCAFCVINEYIEANSNFRRKDGLVTVPGYGYESFSPSGNEKCLVLADRVPRTKGHLMIIPKNIVKL